jgi:protein ImuA
MFRQLQQEIHFLHGYQPPPTGVDMGLGALAPAFPNGAFPTSAIHEYLSASAGFIAGLLGTLMQPTRVCLWVGTGIRVFAPGLVRLGIAPERVIYMEVPHKNDLLWVIEEALHCEGLAAVVGDVAEISFTASRLLQLAVEKSRVMDFQSLLLPAGRLPTGRASWRRVCPG